MPNVIPNVITQGNVKIRADKLNENFNDTGNRVTTNANNISALDGRVTTLENNELQSITLTGDITGNANATPQLSVSTTLANSGVTADSYGPANDASLTYAGNFTVPQITVDAKGRVTSASNKTITLPISDNTDTKVTQTVSTENVELPLLAKDSNGTTTTTATSKFAAGVKVNPSTSTITATTFKGDLNGNADSATEFSANKSVTLTGDVTGTASSKAGWSVVTTLSDSGVTADSYGPSDNASPNHSGTFTVPQITVDSKGRVTSASNKTITLPADSNTDTLMTQNVSTVNNTYPILLTPTANATANQGAKTGIFASGVKVNPSTSEVVATKFTGALVGNADTATKLAASKTINVQDADATNTGTAASFDGSANATIKLPSTIKADITGDISGNAGTATKLATARDINVSDADATNTGTKISFDGSGNGTIKLPATIKATLTGNASTATKLAAAKNINIQDADGTNTGTAASFDGSAAATIKLPATIKATLTGNADTATKLKTGRSLKTKLDSTTAVTFDGSADQDTIPVTGVLPIANGGTGSSTKNFVDLTSAQSIGGVKTFTSSPVVPTPSAEDNSTKVATTAFVESEIDRKITAAQALVFKGTLGTGGTVTALPNTHKVGWLYVVSTAGTYAGQVCEIGDYIVCVADGTAANNAHWNVLQKNIDGAVTGPASSVANHVVTFSSATGKVVKDSGYTIETSVPSGAVFTDTHYTVTPVLGGSSATSNATSDTANDATYLNVIENSAKSGGIQIVGSGATTVSAKNGVLTISSSDNNTDTLVTQNVSSTNSTYPLLMTPTANASANQGAKTSIFASGIKANPSTAIVTAKGYIGAPISYGTCSTAADVVEKEVTLQDASAFSLTTGSELAVKFTVTNTATSPTLKVNSLDAKPIFYRGAAINKAYLAANRIYKFVYDGTNFELVGDINTDTNNVTAQNISTNNNTFPILIGYTANATANIGNKATYFCKDVKLNPSTGIITANGFNGPITGNASSATEFASNQSVTLTGDVTGTASSKAGWSIATTLANSGVTANDYGDTTQQTPSHGGTFNIPYFTVNSKGLVTAAGTTTVKLPADNNTDTLVTQNVSTANENHPILLSVTKDATANQGAKTAIFASGVKVNPSTSTITATTFSGTLSGNASSATEFSTTATVALTGDATGTSAASKKGWSVPVTLANTGVTAADYGNTTQQTPAHGGTFNIPYFSVDAKGRITTAGTTTVKLPADNNTDTKVNVTLGTTTKAYLLGTSTTPTSTATGVTAISDTGVYLDTTAGKLTATTFNGALSGNADTATEFHDNTTVALTGDATGTSSGSKRGWSVPVTLTSTGVTANSYGPSTDASPAHQGTFTVPYFTVDAKGRITAASNKTITLPSDNNTDTKVTNTLGTTTKAYITGTTSATTNTGTQIFDTGVYLSTTAGDLVATTFTGALKGNADTATKAKGVFLVIPNETAQTATLTATVTGITEYFAGLTIALRMPFNTPASATLNINSLGAKPIYYKVNTTSKDYYPANTIVMLVYETTTTSTGCFKMVYSYDGNTNYYERRLHSNAIKAAAAVTSGTIMVGTAAGFKQVAANVTFDLSYPILYASAAIAANATSTAGYEAYPGVNLQTTKASWTGTQYATVFLVGTLSGNTVTIDSSVFTTTVPSTADGKIYIPLGVLYSTYQVYFAPTRDVYQYTNGSFHRYDPTTAETGGTNGTIKINGSEVAVKGLGTAAYTASTAYAAASHGTHVTYASSGTPAAIGTASNGTATTVARSDHVHALPNSGVTADSYGPSANATPAHSGTFTVPYITVDATGRITAASNKTITLPASGNTDTKVNVTLGTTTKAYLLGTSTTPTATATGVTAISDTGVYLNNVAGELVATKFTGNLNGKFVTARNIDGVAFDGSAAIVHYASCATAAATAQKEVTCTGFALDTGARISVKFTVTNTAANPTLKVNSLDAKAIFYRGAAISAGYLAANRVYEFVYDGTNFELVGDINTDTNTKVTQTITTTNAEYAVLAMADAAATANKTNTSRFGQYVTLNPSTSIITAKGFKGPIISFGECSTAAATAAKTVSIGTNNFGLVTGVEVTVKFTVTNTADNPTLAVNGTTAKAIYYKGSAIDKNALVAGAVYKFVYDGTYWQVIGDLIESEFEAITPEEIDEIMSDESA